MNAEKIGELKGLLAKFGRNGVSHDPKKGLQDVLRYQDLIGRSSIEELAEFERGLNHDECRLFVFANTATLDQNTCIDIYVKTVGRRKIIEVYEKERSSLVEWELKLDEREKALRIAEKANATAVESANNVTEQAKRELREAMRHHSEREEQNAINVQSYRRHILDLEEAIDHLSKENADLQAVKRVLAGLGK